MFCHFKLVTRRVCKKSKTKMNDMKAHSDSPEISKHKDSSAIQSAEVQASWKWDENYKAECIDIDFEQHVAIRNSNEGRHPCLLASEPLTRQKDCFRIKVDKVGRFIGIGVADRNLSLDYGKAIFGGQIDCINAAYFTQSNTIRKLHSSDKFVTQAELIRTGDIIDTKMDFDNGKLYFWLNNKPQGSIDLNVAENEIYPAISLSQFSKVTLLSLDHISEGLDLETRLQQMLDFPITPMDITWKWNCNRKSPAINVTDRDCRIAVRVDEGYNPLILTSNPFSKENSHFRIQVVKLTNYLGIGMIEGSKAMVEGGSILGQQNIGAVNASYFWHQSSPPKFFMFGEEARTADTGITEGSIVDVVIDFDWQQILYYIDEIFVGFSQSTRFKMIENMVFPCVNLSNGTQVVLLDEKEAVLERPQREVPWALPITGNSWEWGKKANEIVMESNNIISRNAQGHNPSIMATPAFSRQRDYFQVKVLRRGSWIAIGLCDSHYVINGGTTLGTQKNGLNASYYFKQYMGNLRMNGNTISKVSSISDGDTVSLYIDFMCQRVYFLKNKEIMGFVESPQIKEGQVFPCICLGVGSRIEMTQEKSPTAIIKQNTTLPIEFFKFSILCEDGNIVERNWHGSMTVKDCCNELNQDLALFYPEKKIYLSGKISDYKWKKINKLELKKEEDERPSIEGSSSSGSFFNLLFKKM